MMKFEILLVAIIVACSVQAQHYGGDYHYDHGPNYEYQYEVHDPYHHDFKSQAETKIGSLVKGHYSLKETDGSRRDVVYQADKHSGFQAVVHKDGQQVFPPIVTKAQYAIPVHHRPQYQQPQYHQPQYQQLQYQQPQYHQPQYHQLQYQQPQYHQPQYQQPLPHYSF